jgi:hypothetical protein
LKEYCEGLTTKKREVKEEVRLEWLALPEAVGRVSLTCFSARTGKGPFGVGSLHATRSQSDGGYHGAAVG